MVRALILALAAALPCQATEIPRTDWVGPGALAFPDGVFDAADPARDLERNRAWSTVMAALDEAPLTQLRANGALVRLTVIAPRATPFVLRLSRTSDGFALEFRIAFGLPGNPGGIDTRDRFTLDEPALVAVLSALQDLHLCARPSDPPDEGPLWIVESLNGPYCARALSDPHGPAPSALLQALTAPMRGRPPVVRAAQTRAERRAE